MPALDKWDENFMLEAIKRFSSLGFQPNKHRYEKQTLYRSILIGSQYIHFAFSGYEERQRISVNIGISCYTLENIFAEIQGDIYDLNEPRVGTIGADLGLLSSGHRKEWIVTSEMDKSQIIDAIKNEFEIYGLPHLNKFQSLEDVLKALSNVKQQSNFEVLRSPLDHIRSIKAVIASFLIGNVDTFEKTVDREAEIVQSKGELEYRLLSHFVDELRKKLN